MRGWKRVLSEEFHRVKIMSEEGQFYIVRFYIVGDCPFDRCLVCADCNVCRHMLACKSSEWGTASGDAQEFNFKAASENKARSRPSRGRGAEEA